MTIFHHLWRKVWSPCQSRTAEMKIPLATQFGALVYTTRGVSLKPKSFRTWPTFRDHWKQFLLHHKTSPSIISRTMNGCYPCRTLLKTSLANKSYRHTNHHKYMALSLNLWYTLPKLWHIPSYPSCSCPNIYQLLGISTIFRPTPEVFQPIEHPSPLCLAGEGRLAAKCSSGRVQVACGRASNSDIMWY